MKVEAGRDGRDTGGAIPAAARLFLFCFFLLPAGAVHGQCEAAKLLPADGAAQDLFGASVAISENVAVVGSPQDDDSGGASGSAYTFRLVDGAWIEEPAKLLAMDGSDGQFFGYAVAIDGDYAVVGAWGDDANGTNAGAAYVFRADGSVWMQQARLTASDGEAGDELGRAVAISGDVVLVGAPHTITAGSGAAYVFRRSGEAWAEEAKLFASDGSDDQFGHAVSVSGDVAIIGAHQDGQAGIDAGAAWVYRYQPGRAGWVQEAKLIASDAAGGDQLGFSVAIDGEIAIVGANRDSDHGDRSGSAYIFEQDETGWTESTKLLASDGEADDHFGHSVAIEADIAIIGARWDADDGYHAGAAYVFGQIGSSWQEDAKLLAADGDAGDKLGFTVGLSGSHAIAGAFGDDDHGSDSGSAVVFDIAEPDCNENRVCDAVDILGGTSADVNGNGVPDECEDLCPADVNDDGAVNITDLLVVLATWGPCPPTGDCFGDVDASGAVDVLDLLAVLAAWAPCP
jgi:hypothetical protein